MSGVPKSGGAERVAKIAAFAAILIMLMMFAVGFMSGFFMADGLTERGLPMNEENKK